MKIKNYTNFETVLLRDIIRFCKPSGVSNFDISFKNCAHAFRGRAYTQGCAYHDTASPLVIISIGTDDKYPRRIQAHDGYLAVDIYTRLEALILVTAHELRHLWQAKHPRGWRVWGARGQYSERDADAYAIKTLRAWRKEPNMRNPKRSRQALENDLSVITPQPTLAERIQYLKSSIVTEQNWLKYYKRKGMDTAFTVAALAEFRARLVALETEHENELADAKKLLPVVISSADPTNDADWINSAGAVVYREAPAVDWGDTSDEYKRYASLANTKGDMSRWARGG